MDDKKINKEQIEKLNNLIGALICHGKDDLDYDYVEDDLIEYFIEEFLYTLDDEYRSYLDVTPLYKYVGREPNGPRLYEKTENEYKSDFEVQIVERDKNNICVKCACYNCQAAHDRFCPGEEHFEKNTNCDHCKYSHKVKDGIEKMDAKSNFKKKCDGKFDAVKSWCIECSTFDMITPLVDEWREERKKINFKRAIKAWREVYHYTDSFYYEDEDDTLKEPIYPFRYWYWIRYVGNAIEYGLWGIIDYFNIFKPEDKEWYWYKRMQTYLPTRQEGDIMPHLHFNEYIYYINQYLNKNEIEKKEVLKNILDRIREESDIISHWGQNGAFSAIAPGDMEDLSTMPCEKDYYIKIENLCKDFMEYIKGLMSLKDEHDVMDFIGYSGNSLGYALQIESKR